MSEIRKSDHLMTETEVSHQEFLKFINTPFAIKGVKGSQKAMRFELKQLIGRIPDRMEKQFLRWIEEMTSGDYYHMGRRNTAFGLLKRNLKALMIVSFSTPNEELKDYYDGYARVIELVNIDSAEKGEGYKAVKELLGISDSMRIPISLWTEIEGNVPIFERYGFINKGRLGIKNEFLMIRFPKG
ncbi:hypothetical protein AB7942_30510 [Neobacillus sp. BF23-41]|uniref:hypothetical protein n=1 Tax=Neobacillus sp. BF23-41 TaxID=3240280 RepID=UPI0034E48EB0